MGGGAAGDFISGIGYTTCKVYGGAGGGYTGAAFSWILLFCEFYQTYSHFFRPLFFQVVMVVSALGLSSATEMEAVPSLHLQVST